jgi:PAS domain S-box-containing protein
MTNETMDHTSNPFPGDDEQTPFRLLVGEIKDYVIYMITVDGEILTWNAGAQRVKGYRADEAIGRNFSMFFTQEDIDAGEPQRELRETLERGRYEAIGWRVRKNGTRFRANEIANLIRGDDGEVRGIAKITRNLDELDRARRELEASEQRYRLLVNEVRDYAIFMLDLEGRVETWNAGARRILGYEDHEVLGQNGRLFYVPEDQALGVPEAEIVKARTTGRAEDERWHMRRDGSRFWASGVLSSIRGPWGELQGFAKVMRDLTEQKRIQDERSRLLESEKAAREEAETLNRMKDEFLAMLSHELRTPISAILGWVQLLASDQLPEAQRRRAIEIIQRNSRLEVQLIEDLLDTSRVISGQLRLKRSILALDRLAAAAVESLRQQAEAKGIALHAELDADVEVSGDPDRLEQVILNLMSNALKFTPPGGRIEISLKAARDVARLSVSDNGEGMSAEFLPRAFEQFQQADTSLSRRHGGLGLGLSIVSHIVQLHRGKVSAESPGVGQGSTFTVELPLVTARQREDMPAAPLLKGETSFQAPASLRGLQVLLVEDDPDMRHYLTFLLTLWGCNTLSAASVGEGLSHLREKHADVVISDIAMPNEDGFAFASQKKQIERDKGRTIPMVAMTALTGEAEKKRIREAGFDAFIAKPLSPERLARVMEELTGHRDEPGAVAGQNA